MEGGGGGYMASRQQQTKLTAHILILYVIAIGRDMKDQSINHVDKAIEDNTNGYNIMVVKKATPQATCVIHSYRKESLFFLQTNWTLSYNRVRIIRLVWYHICT